MMIRDVRAGRVLTVPRADFVIQEGGAPVAVGREIRKGKWEGSFRRKFYGPLPDRRRRRLFWAGFP